jgi:ABC-type proline/glycine betaine transport system substrate-binding protein
MQKIRGFFAIASIVLLLANAASLPALAADPAKSSPVKIAVFEFELDDVSPAAAAGASNSGAGAMEKVTSAARRVLAQSGRYSVIDVSMVDAKPVKEKSLRDCNGCEAGIALQLGADQSLIGVVRRVTMTDYYIWVQISDAHTGKVLDQQAANFAGGDDGWASGVASLIRRQVLVDQN